MDQCAVCGKKLKDKALFGSPDMRSKADPGICHRCWYVQDLERSTKDLEKSAREEETRKELLESAATLPITTGFTTVAGPVLEELDIITSECVLGVNLFKDFLGGVRDIVGGRAGTHQQLLKDLRRTCLDEFRINAVEIGADAVIGVDLNYSEISGKNGGLLMLVASGTAVKLGPKQ